MIIDQLPALATAGDNDEIAIEVGTTTYKMTKANFLKEFMPKSGGEFTGSVTVTGVLDVTPRRCYALLSSAGWYRVINFNCQNVQQAKFSYGAKIDITIGSNYYSSLSHVHEISLLGAWDAPIFVNEASYCNGNAVIDKIRYTYDSSGNGHVDVHYPTGSTNGVFLTFSVHCEAGWQGQFVASDFVSAADSPSGETVLTEYAFSSRISAASWLQYSEIVSSFSNSAPLGGYYHAFTNIKQNEGVDPMHVLSVFTDWNGGGNSVIGWTAYGGTLYVSFVNDTTCSVYITYFK